MNYDNAELLQQLAAEYVIGTLRGAARRRFEQLIASRADARHQVEFWELRLAEFGQIIVPVVPPQAARIEMLRRAAPAAPPASPQRKFSPRRRARWAWPYAAGFATAASLVLAFLLGQRNPLPDARPATAAVAGAQQLPIYSAQLGVPASSVQWLLSVSSDRRKLTAVAADDFLQIGRHSVQLWCVTPGQTPVALGLLPNERDATASFDIPAMLVGKTEVTFLISLEPLGGSPSGRPSALVLNRAAALDGI